MKKSSSDYGSFPSNRVKARTSFQASTSLIIDGYSCRERVKKSRRSTLAIISLPDPRNQPRCFRLGYLDCSESPTLMFRPDRNSSLLVLKICVSGRGATSRGPAGRGGDDDPYSEGFLRYSRPWVLAGPLFGSLRDYLYWNR